MLDDDGRYVGCFCAAGQTVGSRDLDNPAPWGRMSQFKCREWWGTVSGFEEFHDLGSLSTATVFGKGESQCYHAIRLRLRATPTTHCTSRASSRWKLPRLPSRVRPQRGRVLPRPCRPGDRPWSSRAASGVCAPFTVS